MYACFPAPLSLSRSLWFFFTLGLEVQGGISPGRAPYPWRITISIFFLFLENRCLFNQAATIETDDIQTTEFHKCTCYFVLLKGMFCENPKSSFKRPKGLFCLL